MSVPAPSENHVTPRTPAPDVYKRQPLGDVLRAIQSLFTGETAGAQNYSIIVNLRLPRILMAIVVGAGLTCAGNTYQALFSNPLATPDILGVTRGTCVGAILALSLIHISRRSRPNA